jgi:4-amino-4-deoxy-L-arabinose transferase-like glycosyltransferase
MRWVAPLPTLAAFAVVAVVVLLATRGRASGSRSLLRAVSRDAVSSASDRAIAVVALAVATALAYAVALTLSTPQNDFDTIYDHLWRAVLWFSNRAIGYPDCACAPYINAYPPVGEMGAALTMVLGRADRYVALPQTVALLAIVVGVVGIGRRIGASRAEALLGGLLVATLPVVALQASTAQNDLIVASFLVAATVLLLDRGRHASWLAALAVALAIGTKVSAPFSLPLLLVVAVLGRPVVGRAARVGAVTVGTAIGGTWYLVNRHQTGSLDGGFPEIPVEHTVVAALSRISRFGIEFVDVSGARGADLYLYVVVGAAVALGVALGRRGRPREAVVVGAVVLGLAVVPVALPEVGTFLERVHVNVFEAIDRPDLNVDIGRDIRKSASSFSWYGPLGSLLLVGGLVGAAVSVRRGSLDRLALVFAAAPLYWLVVFGASLYYQEFAGRFFMYPIALAAATWGIVLRSRPVAWGVVSIAVTALALALLNDAKRPSGLRLLEPDPPSSYFVTPRWKGQGDEARAAELTRYIDDRVPTHAEVALAITASDPGYLFYGRGLDRRITLIDPKAADAPSATWAFVSPGAGEAVGLCETAWKQLPERPQGWRVYRRIPGATCV